MRVGVIIPDRCDRPKLIENCFRQLANQSLRPHFIIHVNEKPSSELPDLTKRYKNGYLGIQKKSLTLDFICFIENDDWYHEDYIKFMADEWDKAGRPDLFGIDYTYYYHLPTKKYFKYGHAGRASMMNTCIKPGLNIKWPPDNYRFVDMYLWEQFNQHRSATIAPEKIYSIGMKGHSEGMHGGTGHNDRLFRYTEDDNGFLKNTLDQPSFEFFSQYVN